MESNNVAPAAALFHPQTTDYSFTDDADYVTTTNVTKGMAETMDIDVDMDVDPELAALQAEADAIEARTQTHVVDNGHEMISDEQEEGEVDTSQAAPTKIHVSGVDHLTTDDIKRFAAEHYPSDQFLRVEWIDDHRAKLVYESEGAAAEALYALSANGDAVPAAQAAEDTQWRAKTISTHPDTELYVRQARLDDIKAPKAAERSRFYLMNPEYDPAERRARQEEARRGRGGRGRGRDEYHKRTYDDREHRRRTDDEKPFDVNMYDDDAGSLAARITTGPSRRDSYDDYSSDNGRKRRRVSHDGDLFANKSNGRLRDRSASPVRDGDGRYGFEEDQPRRRTARRRSRTPPRPRSSADNRSARDNMKKELFPGNRKTSEFTSSGQATPNGGHEPKELFPHRNRELFPNKTPNSNHRRQDAMSPHEAATLLGEDRPRDLFSRTAGSAPQAESSYGRLTNKSSKTADDHPGFSIKGTAKATSDFSILGAAKEAPVNPLVKELFPMKSGNTGKELFDGRIKGRGAQGAQRRKAEDLF